MIEPKRLLDEGGDDLVRELLRSAEDDVPDAAVRAKTLAKIAAGGAATGGAATTAGAFGWKWIAAVVVGSGLVAALALRPSPPPTAPAPIVVPSAPASTPANVAPSANLAPPPSAPASASATLAPPDSPAPSAAPKPLPLTPTPREIGLADETRMLDEARTALAKGDPRGALLVLDRYDREAKQRVLGPEATMVRIEALHARGDDKAARAIARRFLAANPGSAYEDRVRSLLGEVSPP